MGCDIHVRAEQRTETGWEVLDLGPGKYGDANDPPEEQNFYIDRSYSLFALLGMTYHRPEVGPVIAELRGFPDDAAPETRAGFDAWMGDGHSPGWLTIAEIDAHMDRPEIADFLAQLVESKATPFQPTDRIVFWFDS